MNAKAWLMCGLVGPILLSFSKPSTHMKTVMEKTIDGAIVYQKNYSHYKYYIETIGTVSIDQVSLEKRTLTATYSYQQGYETRQVVSSLLLDKDGIYKGTCTTKVNGKTLFAVNTHLTFKEDGTASGNWSWSGQPSHNHPIVTISKS
ncbi:hypothetical protein BKI52_08605 [marine bacterium AO1-C]|nr:hypothetical protein BKI52_08605 [marine bacterium AO1-C]